MPTVQTRKPAAERKAQIIDEAMRLAAELGPDRMTTQKLADAVGVTQAAVFRHFPSKAEIWQAVAKRIASAMPPIPQESELSAPQRLRAIVQRQFEFIVTTPAIPAILYSRELHAENEALSERFSTMIAARQARVAAIFEEGARSGTMRADLNPQDEAGLVLALIQGLAMRWSLENQGFDLAQEGMRLFDIQMQAFGPQ